MAIGRRKDPVARLRVHPDRRIWYATARSGAGTVLMAATQRGVCRVYLGDRASDLLRRLRTEFPHARVRRDAQRLGPWLRACLDGRVGEVPLDLRATGFQRKVWEALQLIPPGQRRTYGEVARGLGRPGAARAVARACAANPVALLIPCHRVVRSDGSPGGYRWGSERKRVLLEQEAAGLHRVPFWSRSALS